MSNEQRIEQLQRDLELVSTERLDGVAGLTPEAREALRREKQARRS